jgi:hypothetical protein
LQQGERGGEVALTRAGSSARGKPNSLAIDFTRALRVASTTNFSNGDSSFSM